MSTIFNRTIRSVIDSTVPDQAGKPFFAASGPPYPLTAGATAGSAATPSTGTLLIDASTIPSWTPGPTGVTGYTAGDVPLIKVTVGATIYCIVLTSAGAVAVRTVSA